MPLLTITIELGPRTMALLEAMMADLTQAVNDLTAAVSGVTGELSTLVTELKAAVAANNPAAIQAAADSIEAQVTILKQATAGAQTQDPTVTGSAAGNTTPATGA